MLFVYLNATTMGKHCVVDTSSMQSVSLLISASTFVALYVEQMAAESSRRQHYFYAEQRKRELRPSFSMKMKAYRSTVQCKLHVKAEIL